jgi:hypothetical protein
VTALACIEVGASGCQTVLLRPEGHPEEMVVVDGAMAPQGMTVLVAAPGLIVGTRVLAASNLGWQDADPLEQLGLAGEISLLRNDAEAAALGEWALRGCAEDLVFVGLGTGVGGAVVRDGAVRANLFGHLTGFGERPCPCSQHGCLETVAAGWALPDPVTDLAAVAQAVADAITRTPDADARLVVLAGGLTRRHPELLALLAAALPHRVVEPSAAPPQAKSAAAWGLACEHERRREAPAA